MAATTVDAAVIGIMVAAVDVAAAAAAGTAIEATAGMEDVAAVVVVVAVGIVIAAMDGTADVAATAVTTVDPDLLSVTHACHTHSSVNACKRLSLSLSTCHSRSTDIMSLPRRGIR